MVKLFEQTHIFEHSWQSVTQAIWNKYPNPWASHVLTADVIDRYVDPETGVLHTTRLFTKEGRLPKWSKSMFSLSEAYILEISELDPVKKTFKTVTRNLSHAKLMLVEETQIVSPTDSKPSGTAIHITARIISNTGWFAVRSRIEQFGASKIRENTMRSSIGLMHVIEDLKRRKLIV
ncbi:PRELI-like family-domain-containing protein [Obelidium mucronatum]|nr:PRELI-like family-domain-containing protein [Obelidium mucronatum]